MKKIYDLKTGKIKEEDYLEEEIKKIEEENEILQKQNEIQSLKLKLQQTDYQAIKYAEGELTAEEYEPMKIQRKEWRYKINELEAQLEV